MGALSGAPNLSPGASTVDEYDDLALEERYRLLWAILACQLQQHEQTIEIMAEKSVV